MPKLTDTERDAFLTEPGVLMRIAVTRSDGSPLVTPIWFIYEDGAIYFTPREKSEWFACLRRDNRCALCIDEQPLPYRKVLIEGAAELVHDTGNDDVWRDRYRRIAERYVPPAAADDYIENTIDQPRGLYRLPIAAATKLSTWRMPLQGEAAEGIWHDRYYRPDTQFGRNTTEPEPTPASMVNMDCPKCAGTLEPKTYGHKIHVHRCNQCGGLWTKPHVLAEMKKEWMSEAVLDTGDPRVGTELDALDNIECPEGHGPMAKMVDEKQTHIWYEACEVCGGMFFDAGEFTDLKYETFMDRLRDLLKGRRPD